MTRLAYGIASGIALALAACGTDAVKNPDYGSPPDAGAFNPGASPGADGYGSGSGGPGQPQPGNPGGGPGETFDAGPPTCVDDLKRCLVAFTYPYGGESSVELRGDYRAGAWQSGDAMTRAGDVWSVNVNVPFARATRYKFFVNGSDWKVDDSKPKEPDADGNTNNVTAGETCADFTCAQPDAPPPGVFDWRDAVIYFAFVDRFLNGDKTNDCAVAGVDSAGQYKGGDWAGVTQKIQDGYFTGLGVNTIWLTVPLKNADTFAGHGTGTDTHKYSAYHGYWPLDPNQTESCFGAPSELTSLVTAAHAKKLKVLFDYAMVHVEIASPVYQAHKSWFWENSKDNHDCICGSGCDWNTDAQRCWFTDYLPHWNYTVAEARDYSVKAAVDLAKQTGADGFRLDAIKHVDTRWLTQLRASVQAQIVPTQTPPQRFYMVGETFDYGNPGFIRSFVDPKAKLDGQFDFPLRLHLAKATLLRQEGMDSLSQFMDQNEDYYGTSAVMSTFIGNHDLPRSIHLAQDAPPWSDPYTDGKDLAWSNSPGLPAQRSAFERLANAFAVLMTNKGAPLIYYGDEIGLPGAGDPDNRRTMQWDNVNADQEWLRARIKALTAIRAAHPALRSGRRQTLSVGPSTWVYSMTAGADVVYVAINRGDTQATVEGVPSGLGELLTGMPGASSVPPRQTRIFAK